MTGGSSPGGESDRGVLGALLEHRRDDVIRRWTATVREREPSLAALEQGALVERVSILLDCIIAALQRPCEEHAAEMSACAEAWGSQREQLAIDIEALAREHGVLRDVVFDVVEESGAAITVREMRALNQCLTTSLASALRSYARGRERELRRARDELQAVIDRAPTVIYAIDRAERFLFANRRLGELLHFDPAAAIGKTVAEVVGAELEARHREKHRQVMEEGKTLEHEDVIVLDGQERHFLALRAPLVDEQGQIYGMCGIATDITGRHFERQALLRDEARHRIRARLSSTLIEREVDVADVCDATCRVIADEIGDFCSASIRSEDGEQVSVKSAWSCVPELMSFTETLVALPPLPLQGEGEGPWGSVIRGGRPYVVERVDEAAVAEILKSVPPELAPLLGELAPASVAILPMRTGGRVVGGLTLARLPGSASLDDEDVALAQELADRAALAVDRARLVKKLEDAASVRENVVAIVSHDLRSPLSAIQLTAERLLRRAPGALDEESVRRGLSTILSSSQRAARMIQSLLDFTRARVGVLPIERSRADLAAIVARVVDEVRNASPGSAIVVDAEGEAWGSWDADRLSQALTNLVDNAVRHGSGEAPVDLRLRLERDTAVVDVHNQGPPIPRDILPQLFQAFRGGGKKGSLGLGLFVCSEIVRAHGGSLAVVSDEEHGTTFTLRLPRGT